MTWSFREQIGCHATCMFKKHVQSFATDVMYGESRLPVGQC